VNSDTPLLLFFTTPSSGPARRMESLLAQIAYGERDRLRVVAVDVARSRALAKALAVERIPTLLLVRDGGVLGRLEGRVSRPRIDALIGRHLAAEPRAKAA
jgi:thioredoxin 1